MHNKIPEYLLDWRGHPKHVVSWSSTRPMEARTFLEDLRQRVPVESLAEYAGKIAFDLAGEKGGQYTLVITEEGVLVDDGLHDDAHCGLEATYETLIRVVRKEENVLMAMMMGKLKVRNQGEMIRYAKILGFM